MSFRRTEIEFGMVEDLSILPRDMGYDADSAGIKHVWNRCGDDNIVPSIFREWRDETNRLHFGLRRDTETILKIDIKGDDISDEDRYKRSLFIDNIEMVVGKGSGEAWLGWDPMVRWSKLLDYVNARKIFPREKVGLYHSLYTTVNYDGHLFLQQKSVDRAHSQVHNQNKKNFETYVEIPPGLNESQLWIRIGNSIRQRETLEQSATLHKIQETAMFKRLSALRKGGSDMKELYSSDVSSKPFDFLDVDDIVNRKDREGF